MPSSTFQMQGIISGMGTGSQSIATPPETYAAAVGTRLLQNLVNGDNTITLPTGCNRVVIQPPAGNANNLGIKNIGTDSIFPISNTLAYSFCPRGQASFIINSVGATNGVEILYP